MSVLHLNELTMSTEDGKRRVIHEYDVKRKYQERISKKKVKNQVKHTWRDEIERQTFILLRRRREEVVARRRKVKEEGKKEDASSDDEESCYDSDDEAETEVELDSDGEDAAQWVEATLAEEQDRIASRAAFAGLQLDPDSDSEYEDLPHQQYCYDTFNGLINETYEEFLIKRSNNS